MSAQVQRVIPAQPTGRRVVAAPPPPSPLRDGEPPDLLSAFLGSCKFRCEIGAPWELTTPWGLRFTGEFAKFVLVLNGPCLLESDEQAKSLALAPYEIALHTRATPLVLRDRSGSPVIPVPDAHQGGTHDRASVISGTAESTRLLCGAVVFDDDYSQRAFRLLPAVVCGATSDVIAANSPPPLIRALLDEVQEDRPGGELLTRCLVQALLVQALRTMPTGHLAAEAGLIPALRDPGMGAVLAAIHHRPECGWSVRELADIAGLSRAAFAVRFVDCLGRPPFEYLRDVRMHLACELLRDTERGVKEIAGRVGYATEASFSKAFARWKGVAPGEFRRQNRSSRN
ncbi:MAG: helix-turn-helix domain-containing protein [Planctomycetaceae bacterium]